MGGDVEMGGGVEMEAHFWRAIQMDLYFYENVMSQEDPIAHPTPTHQTLILTLSRILFPNLLLRSPISVQ